MQSDQLEAMGSFERWLAQHYDCWLVCESGQFSKSAWRLLWRKLRKSREISYVIFEYKYMRTIIFN